MYTVFDEGEIVNVAVNPKYRRQGIGEQMLKLLFGKFHTKTGGEFLFGSACP